VKGDYFFNLFLINWFRTNCTIWARSEYYITKNVREFRWD